MKNYVTTLGIVLTLALPHAARAQGITPAPVPTNIEVPVKGGRPAIRPAIRSDRSVQAPTSNRSRGRGRSKKRIVAGAIAGSVGGFFAGGFLGAHIEGDRCNCDDPGVRGFLIGAPIGALAGGIFGAKFLF
jgi:hypothetical protein